MVKKLFKHEYMYYLKTLIIFLPVILFLGIFNKIIMFFENDSFSYNIMHLSSLAMLYIASFASFFLVLALSITRFYKNLFTSEGYLTFTLPVSNHQHIFVKLISSLTCYLVTIFTVILAWVIVGIGEEEFLEFIIEMSNIFFLQINTGHLILYIFEIIILILVLGIYSHFVYYCCICIGQLSNKNRVFSAIGVYFIYNFIKQIIGTFFLIISTIVISNNHIFDAIENFFTTNPYLAMHFVLWFIILFYGGLSTLFYCVIIKILNNRLNIE